MSSHTPASTVFLALERQSHELLQALPAAIYVTDAAGRVTFYNEAAAELWGCRPELGKIEFSDFWKLLAIDGTPLPHDQFSMALALQDRQPSGCIEAVAERADGTRILFLAYPTPLYDESGALTGAVNMLVDITERRRAELDARRLAAIVESSDDAILAKDLNGVIVTWNRGAERLYGYTQDEVVGKPVTILIPADRHDEEPTILARIRRGERIEHYETIRRRKDGSLVEISLTVSPIKSRDGRIVGASKIARDITQQRRAQERQQLLLREMNHRVKNLFTIANSLVSLSARSAKTPRDLASDVGARLAALARAHELTLSRTPGSAAPAEASTTLHALLTTIIAPYDDESQSGSSRLTVGGCDLPLSGEAVTSLALLLYEFATNATKYGALSTPYGYIDIHCSDQGEHFLLTWTERGAPAAGEPREEEEGYGSVLERATVNGQLGGEISREWAADGLTIRLSLLRERLTG